MSRLAVGATAALLAPGAGSAPDSPPETALEDYVGAPDPSFAWRVQARHRAPGADVIELRLHSQTWQGTLWKHRLHVIRPDGLEPDVDQGLLVIGGGRWRERYDAEPPGELSDEAPLFIGIARRLGTIVAVVEQVPFQPMFGLREDELIAHTFERYLATGNAEWPLLLPMVKSAVRAMDAVQTFAAGEWRIGLERFTLLGGSKRGWTTYLTGAVDARAATLVPIVIDVLNFAAHMPHQQAAWGEPSPQIAPYTRRGLDEVLGREAGRALRRIVDPYSYRDELAQPKLIVIATNDAYFPLDALNLYWDDLPEPKRVLYLPNGEHGIEDFARLIPALHAVHRRGEAGGEPLPRIEWELDRRGGRLSFCVRAQPSPAAVTGWSAESADTDFRDAHFAPSPAERRDGGAFVFEVPAEADGFRALFAEALFDDALGGYMLSTNVRIVGPSGEAPFPATALPGTDGVCPAR